MNSHLPFFSIIIPTFNRASFICKAVDSVLAQTFSNWELILVDDGSTDNTSDLISQYSDDRIKYFKTPNRERGAARNFGIEKAKGNWICFLDSDDYLLKLHFEIAHSLISSKEVNNVFHLNFEFRDNNDKLIIPARSLPEELNELLKIENPICCSAIFLDAKFISTLRFSEVRELSGTEDYLYWLLIASHTSIKQFNITTVVMLEHPLRSMQEQDFGKAQTRIYKFLEISGLTPSIVEFLGRKRDVFEAYRMSYLSLHATNANLKLTALKFLLLSIRLYPPFLFTKRCAIILKRVIIP
jgi:glycosyltransferase involved in cell wall biosynthesis